LHVDFLWQLSFLCTPWNILSPLRSSESPWKCQAAGQKIAQSMQKCNLSFGTLLF